MESPPPSDEGMNSLGFPPISDGELFASNFTALYHSIFPHKPPPLPSLLSTTSDLRRLLIEHHEVSDHYDLCLVGLHSLSEELDSLRLENCDLRLANANLLRISCSIKNNCDDEVIASPVPVPLERRDPERVTLPKSISVRSTGYTKSVSRIGCRASRSSNRSRMLSLLDNVDFDSVQHKVYVAGGEEVEVYHQGTWKTELCNKWEEMGACPYGENCQFAHGLMELRPVLRHPRYKTQVCKMILDGKICPYGHRCHFRHSLAEHEQLLAPHRVRSGFIWI